jgi:hypothetical protein
MIQGLLETGGIRSFLQPVGLSGIGASWAGYGRGPLRVMADARLAAQAHALLAKTLGENEQERSREIANARHLDEAKRKSQGHGLLGGYGRIYLWSLGTLGVAFAIFLLLRTGWFGSSRMLWGPGQAPLGVQASESASPA